MQQCLSSASTALDRADERAADFWLARALGLSAAGGTSEGLARLLDRRRLPPAAFLSDAYHPGFHEWFASSTYPRWAVDRARIRERYGSMEVAQSFADPYSATIVAYPELQAWFPATEESGLDRRLVIAMISGAPRRQPLLVVGRRISAGLYSYWPARRLDTKGRAVQYLWDPEFRDIDGDGRPELCVRFNQVSGNGFVQKLVLYRLDEQRGPRLWRVFEGRNDGLARFSEGGRIEVAHGAPSMERLSRLEYDLYRYETWEFKDGEFHMAGQRQEAHPLRDGRWSQVCAPS